ncbi:MarR family transcriptional regulator [Spongiactinospora gelatinilytica]|uniref:MarR family transcriptional regulator n=1 Tax=Spongiactinospora gelatinilytica TaxID=2666298 RepID=A0A2W2FQQ0_9ACTN|nr:MarR family winged helix-turn-helix transcriptional regulator [Spongiactinospora gelatinilytica]PZG38063.1 MarR family transcriptional regulator [Spongiactinospora gelatinilytica]
MTDDDRPSPPTSPTSPSLIVLALARQVETRLNAALAPLDLTVGRFGMLGHISAVPGISFSDLARMAGITVQSAHGAVRALVGAGLVRDNTARAGSASAIEITPEGARLLRAAKAALREVDEELFGPDADPIMRRVAETIRAAFTQEP